MDYVAYSLELPAVKALKTAFPVCGTVETSEANVEGSVNFTVKQKCKKSNATANDQVNDSVTITITGSSAPWGEIDDVEVKVGTFCAGNCEV